MALRGPDILEDTLSADERAVLAAFVSEVKSHFETRLERISVFGSRARGDLGEDSDIDVLVVLHVSRQDERRAADTVWELLTRARALAADSFVPVSPIVFAVERFEELKSRERRFALDADAEGIRL